MKKLVFLIFLFLWVDAHAYIDPGTGSAIISAIVGFCVAIGVALKTYWYKLKGLFTPKKVAEAELPDEPVVETQKKQPS